MKRVVQGVAFESENSGGVRGRFEELETLYTSRSLKWHTEATGGFFSGEKGGLNLFLNLLQA